MATRHQVIFDTDIGTDVDDILALGFLLGSPGEIDLVGVTTVYGDVGLRARMAQKLLQLRGRAEVPVHLGVSDPLLKIEPIYWPGHEGVGLLQDDDDLPAPSETHAVDFLIDTVLANPGEITLLAVGPLTNVATAILREPGFAPALRNLTVMGGRVDMSDSARGPSEHNITCDPEAASVVFNAGIVVNLVPLDVTLKALIHQQGVHALKAQGDPYHAALADQVARYPGFVARGGSTFLHDPLAAMALVRPDHLGWQPFHVQVELNGRLTRAMTVVRTPGEGAKTNARIALSLDAPACEALIASRLAN